MHLVTGNKIKSLIGTMLIYTATGLTLRLSLHCEKRYYRRKNDEWYLSGNAIPTYRVYSVLEDAATNAEKKAYEVDILIPRTLSHTASEAEHRDRAIVLFTNVIHTRANDNITSLELL